MYNDIFKFLEEKTCHLRIPNRAKLSFKYGKKTDIPMKCKVRESVAKRLAPHESGKGFLLANQENTVV